MGILTSVGIGQGINAISSGGGGGVVGKIGGAAGKVGDIAGGAVDEIGDVIGIGLSEKVKGWPDGTPTGAPSGPAAGAVYQGGTGDGVPYDGKSLTLRPGRYAYSDLSSAGLHDQISGAKVKSGYTVVFFKGVEGGRPAGASAKITGPAKIPEFRGHPKLDGFENAVSSIAVIPDRPSGGSTAGGVGAPSTDPPPSGAATSAGMASNTQAILVAGIVASIIWFAS